MNGPNLRLTGVPLDLCPFVRLSLVKLDDSNCAILTKEPSSKLSHNTMYYQFVGIFDNILCTSIDKVLNSYKIKLPLEAGW